MTIRKMTAQERQYVVTVELVGPVTPELRELALRLMRSALDDLEQYPDRHAKPGEKPEIRLRLRDKDDVEIDLNAQGLSIAGLHGD